MATTDWHQETIFGFSCRQFKPCDITSTYIDWLNDPQVVEFSDNNQAHTIKSAQKYYKKLILSDDSYFLAVHKSNIHIGNFTITSIDSRNGTFDAGYIIGDKNLWGTNAGENLLALLFSFAFDNLKLRKHFGGITSTNIRARLLAKSFGLFQYALKKNARVHNDGYVDVALVEFSANQWTQCKFLFFK